MCLEWLEISHLSAITNPGTLTHNETPATSFPSRLFLSSALSILTTLDQDPVTDPPKRDWLQERGEFCLPSRSPSLSFLGFLPPSSLSLLARLSLSLLFISRSPLFSLPCLYFLLCRVKSENTELRVLHPQIPACSLSGWILKAKGGTKVQIRFFWIVLLLIQTCPCYLSLSQLLWAAGKGCGKCVCIWLCVFRGHGGNSWSYENAHSGCETWAYCVMVGWLSVHSLTIWESSSNELLNHYFS